jgi:hypothetical protein
MTGDRADIDDVDKDIIIAVGTNPVWQLADPEAEEVLAILDRLPKQAVTDLAFEQLMVRLRRLYIINEE